MCEFFPPTLKTQKSRCADNPFTSSRASLTLCLVRRWRARLSISAALRRGLIGPWGGSHRVFGEASQRAEASPRTEQ